MIRIKFGLFFFLSLMTVLSIADQKIIQIGGGNRIDNSQGQIEDNVIWLNEILKRSGGDVSNYFAAGNGDVKDVSLYGTTELDPLMEPLSRVFGNSDASRLVFKSNEVPNISGSTVKEEITKTLEAVLKSLDANNDLLLIYNGHGGYNSDDFRLNTLKIWHDERLDVAEVDKILDHAPLDATVRYVFPQCYSGGFYYLIYKDPLSHQIATQNRCGFFAESPTHESEGCSLDTNKEEYRDYSTYFFAPLNNATRNGDLLPLSPDFNRDGVISFRELHLYALHVGMGKDLSRSTSEMFLEEWEPWYLRWSMFENRESIYWKIAEYIAVTRQLSMHGNELAKAKRALQTEIDSIVRQQREQDEEISRLANEIKKMVVLKWPEVAHPYTALFLNLMGSSAGLISQEIRNIPLYDELLEMQNGIDALNGKKLELERDIAQIDKIVRMKKLARLESQFSRFADADEKQIYERLLQCENGAFFSSS